MYKKIIKLKRTYFVSSAFLLLYFLLFLDGLHWFRDSKCLSSYNILSDVLNINKIASIVGFNILVFDNCLIYAFKNKYFPKYCENCSKNYVRLGLDYRSILNVGPEGLVEAFSASGFEVSIFHQDNPPIHVDDFSSEFILAFILRKSYVYVIHVLYPREDNSWWFGSLASEKECNTQFKNLLLQDYDCNNSEWHESLLNKFHFTKKRILDASLHNFLIPNDEYRFFSELKNSYFIECNLTRAKYFRKLYGKPVTPEDYRFKHKAWKILSKAKTILDLLSIKFWLSSGTCLGYFRECDIIPYSKDVDIGILARDFNETIISHMELQGLRLKHWFGLINDSLELSFIDDGGVKLDLFFFYDDGNYLWNGGTQLKTRKKFKYTFPKFDLCWTIFCGLKVRVPCQTEEYIIANYGKNWFTPIEVWDWKNSPNNVQFNGYWPEFTTRSRLL